mgnify:CR=1 FL=1
MSFKLNKIINIVIISVSTILFTIATVLFIIDYEPYVPNYDEKIVIEYEYFDHVNKANEFLDKICKVLDTNKDTMFLCNICIVESDKDGKNPVVVVHFCYMVNYDMKFCKLSSNDKNYTLSIYNEEELPTNVKLYCFFDVLTNWDFSNETDRFKITLSKKLSINPSYDKNKDKYIFDNGNLKSITDIELGNYVELKKYKYIKGISTIQKYIYYKITY